METEGLETVHTSHGGNAVAPEGGSFLEPPSIAKVPGEEIFRKQIDLVPCLAEKNEKLAQKDEGFDPTEEEETKENAVVDETKQIAEQEQVSDVTGTILKMDKIEGPCIDIGEEDKKVKHVEAMEDGDGEVEGKPKSIEKEFGGPKKYEEGETKIEESVELGTSKEVSSFEPSSSQGKESLSQTADPTINNLDNPETGEGVQDKRNTEDIATATHETQEKQTEEMYSQQVDKPDVCMVSETESEENVNKSPPGEVQNLILEKTAEAGSSEGENIEDEMKSEQNHDGLVVKHEENKQSMHQGLAMADELTDESRDMEIPTVIAAENNSSDAVPITITAAQDHSVIADEDKIMDVVANIVPDHGKEEMSKYEDQIRETFVQQDEAGHENENSLALISREIDTATSTECSEAIASAKEETPIKITGEDFEDKKEEKPIDTDAVVDSGLPIEKGLPPTDLNEKVEDAGIELQYKNSSELHISHSLEQETMPVQGEKKPEDSGFEPQEQDHEANGQSKDLEKHAEDASEARESMQNTDLENPSGEGAVTAEVNSKADEMAVEREEKVNELESEEKLAIDDAGTNFKEEMQKKEEAHDEQTYEMATSDRIEKVTSDEVCSREFVDEKVERGVQAAGFQEAEIPLKNGVEESYEISSSVNEEVIDEPKIKDVEEVIDEEKIKDEATQLSSELVFEEKIVESSPDKETETEMSKGDDVEEQMMEDNNAKVILRESIQEASVNDCKNEGKNAEKSCREIYEVSEVEKKAETNINDEIPDVSLQASLLKEQESLQTENLTAEPEEKDEDGSSIRKDEDEENNNGLKEVKECSEKETLKGEEDGEQISPKNEPGENLERSASMVSSGTGDVVLNETTQKTEEEIDEGVEGIKKEAEIGKEDGEEQAIDENDDESIQVESIKEVPVSMVPNDENNAEEFEGEIFEESVTAGTNVSFTDATHQNDGAPSAVLETSTVKQMEIVQGEDKDTAPAEASPEEEEEHDRDGGLKRFEDNSSEIRLEGDPKKSDEETSRTIHSVAHEINQHIEFPNSTLETSPVEEQASLKTENPTPAENSPEGKKYEDGSSNKKDEDKEMNTGIAEEKAEENLEQILQNSTLVENPKQPINMICAETEADASSKMVDNREEEIVEIPRENAEAELLKEETIEGNVVEERNINSLSRESDEESPIKDFQNAAKSYERSTEEMLESQIAGGDETRTNDEDCNSSLTVSVDKIDESFKGDDENITPVEASPQDEKEEHGSFNRADDGNDNNPELIVTNQDSSREALKVEEDFEQESQSTEPGEHEESSAVMAAETEAGTLSDKIDGITGQEEVVTIHNIEESMEKEEHGSSNKEGEGNDSNPDLTVANQESVRETSEVQDDSEKELPRIEPGEPEEPSTIMASETDIGTLSDKIDGITGQEEAVTVQNIEETVEKEEHGSSDKEGEENDSNPDLTVANQESVREALEVQGDSKQELSRIELEEPEESSTIMTSETEADTLSDKVDGITGQEKAVTIQNIEETMEKEEHGSSDKEGEENESTPDLTVANQDSVREASEVQDDSEKELPRIERGEPEEPSTIMASETEADTLSDKIDGITGQEEAVTVQNIEETVEKEEHGSSDKEGEGNDRNLDLTMANQDSVREALEVQFDFEKELQSTEPGEPEEPSTIMASETEASTLSDNIDDITSQEEAVTIHNIEETVEKEEHESSDKEGEGNDINPNLTVANQESVREASEVQGDSEQELPRIEPEEPEESSTIMASETEADTLSDKIDDITGQEKAITIHNIEETMEKEEHGSLGKEGEGNDNNPNLTVANQDSVREVSEVQDDSEKELLRIEPGEPEEPSTIMASETDIGTLSDKIDDITGQKKVFTIHNIEETVEKEEHGSSDKEGEGNDSNLDLTVANQDSVREASEVQSDAEQELPRIEPEEDPKESSTIMASETETDTMNDKIDDITGQEEVLTIHNIEETVEKEKKEGSEDVDVTKVERAVMEEDLKLVAEASDANISVENDAEECIISGGKEVETVEKTFRLDFIQKLEVEEKREHKIEETKDEDIKKVQACGDTKLASLSVDTEKYVTAEEHTNTNISPHTTGETTTEEKAETMSEMEESVITSVDKDAEKKVTEEESAINDQSRIIYKGDESGMLVEHEVHEIIKDNNEVPLNSTNEENPLHKETEDESDEVKPNNEVKDSKSEFTEPFEARGLVEIQEFETLRGKQGPSSDIYLEKAFEGVSEKESSKSLNEISCLESESKGEILEEVQPDVNDSRSTLVTGITGETSLKEAEPEDKRQIESFEPAPQEKGPVTGSTEGSTLGSMDIDAEPEDANFIENEDHRIPAASETEELENEMHKKTPLTGREDYEETTNETPLGIVLDDKQEECSAMLPEEPELKTNEGNMVADENPTTYENIETPQTPTQEIEIMLNEDMPINERDASKSVDPRKESIKEDEYSSNVGDEAIECIEATSAERKEVILEEDNPTKKPEDSLTENVEANKAVFELEERTNNQEQAIGTEDYGVLLEENFEVSGKKLEGVFETETGDQSSQNIPEAYSGTVENNTEFQNKSLKSIEQSSQESQEVLEETGEKTELRFETESDVKETQNTDETVKDVLLTEEVHEKVDEAGGETLKSTEKDVNDTLELCAKSTEDVRVHEVNESSLIAGECHDAIESNEQTTIISSDFQEAPTLKEMSLAKAITDEDNEMLAVLSTTTPAEDNEMTGVLSTTTPAEELDEMIKVIKEEDNCRDKIKATAMVEITETSLEEAQLDEKPVQVSNITSNDSVSLEIEAEACQEEKVKDDVGLELPSLNLASQIPIDDHKNILREQVAKENTNADDVQEDERASGVVYESKDHCIEELITSKIKEENEKSSEIDESPGAEAATNEAVTYQNPPEVISKEEQGISATTERREENMKGVEFREDDLRKTEDVSLQKDDDSDERDISRLELQPNKDIQNQSPNEVLEEECETPGETKEEIKEGPKLVSMTNSQGFEALKDDESTSGHTIPEEKSEEQNQTPAVALFSKEKDCGTEMIMENIEEYVHVELPADPHNYSPPKITEDISELDVSGLGAKLNTGIQKDSLNEVQVEESKIPDDASKLQIPEYETSKEAFESMPEVHGFEGFTASEETEIKEKHVVVAITDLAEEENRGEKLIDSAEIMHDGVIEEGTFEGTSNLRTELSKEAVKSVSEVHGHEVLAESDDTEIKVKHPEVTTTDMAAEENLSERTIDAAEIIHDKLKSEEVTKRETQQIMEERENAKNDEPVDLGEETTKECQEEYELKAEESLGDNGTQKDIQNEELYKEVEKADENERTEKKMDTERIIEHLHLAAAENETVKESFLDEAGSEMHLENQICGTASGNDGRTESANVKEEEMDVEISQKEGPSDLVEASEATRDIHEEEETSKTTTEHIEEHAKEVEIEVDELPSATMTAENTCSQKEETKEQEVCGSGVECNIDMQKNDSNEFDEETNRTTDEDSTMEPQGYENKIKDKEYLPESNKMTEITKTGSFEKTSDLRAETSEDTSKSVSEVHELEVLAELEHAEIKKEKHTERLAKQDKQHFKEGKEDTENCKPINLGIWRRDIRKGKPPISCRSNETTQDIHQGERDSDSTSEKPVPVEAETQETTERKKDAPQGLLQEPIVESTQGAEVGESEPGKATGIVDAQGFEPRAEIDEKNVRGNDESISANISLFDMMQNSTRELQVKGDLTEEKESNEGTRFEVEKTKSDEEKEEEEEGEEHKTTDSPVMVEASRDTVDVKVASKKHHSILSGLDQK
ncbi:titin [Salix suchowensis]|nr:titin [Salix suchowensis]